ncbi:MAG: D-xylose ABC transporter substrate-binding protein [Acidobacteria bacterium]|nr:MAG: D-xylose ABC transporter substrate-binding protein [Acidobacteriota bacterium]
MRLHAAAAVCLSLSMAAACGGKGGPESGAISPAAGGTAGKPVTIGFSMDTLKEERWQHDRDLLVKYAEDHGAKVLVQAANGNDALQNSQAENLLTQGVDVLIVVAHNAETAATMVDSAHRSSVPVIAYDRLIRNADVDLYVSFDAVRIGELQSQYAVAHVPKGNYVLIGGAPSDNNALLLREGQMKPLKPLVEKGDIKIVSDQFAKDWQAIEALKIMENALTRAANKVDAVVVSNDGTAGGAIQALAEQKLTGKVLVTGQDADLAACQRILAGTQTMTIYKPLVKEASKAAEMAILLARKQPVPDKTVGVNNGKKDVPSILLEPLAVDKANLLSTVVADGYHKLDDICRDLPKEQCPKQ